MAITMESIATVSTELEYVPLSFAQQRLWFLEWVEPGTALYNVPAAWLVDGPLDPAALARSLDEVVRRHDVLRTTFDVVDGVPLQAIAARVRIELPLLDLSARQNPRECAQRLFDAEAARPFDLKRGPLIRAGIYRLAEHAHMFWLTIHHLVTDGWSTGVLLRELGALYHAQTMGGGSPLAPLAIQYADYALWQREWLQGDALQEQLAHWRHVLLDAPPALDLPTDRPRGPTLTHHGASVEIGLDATASPQFRDLVRRTRTTPFMVLAAVFNVLLHRYSGEDDLCIGYPVANRHRNEIEPLIGFFVNTLVLRTRMAPAQSFEALLAQVRDAVLAADDYQDLPFEKLVEALHTERNPGRSPLFQVMFAYDSGEARLDLRGLATRRIACGSESAKFELTLGVTQRDSGTVATFSYNTDLFDRATIERMAQHYRATLEAAIADPLAAVADLSLLDVAERRRILVDWNDTAVDFPRERCIHELFETQVRCTPDAVAVICDTEQLSYAELDSRADRLARHLRTLGVGPDTLVAICAERSLALIVGLLGILKAGGAYVPLDPQWPPERHRKLIRKLASTVTVTTQAQLALMRAVTTQDDGTAHQLCVLDGDAQSTPGLSWPFVTSFATNTESVDAFPCTVATDPSRRAYVIFTSGSTGEPKGVVMTHRPVVNLIAWVNSRAAVTAGDRLLFVTSACFDLSVYDVFGTLAAGGIVDIVPQRVLDEPAEFAVYAQERPITFWDSAPASLQFLTELMSAARESIMARSLRLVFLSGDWIPLDMPARIRALFPHAQLVALGGATEAAIWSNAYVVGNVSPHWQSIPYGKPIQNARYYILDERLAPAPVGVAGDLYIGGECLASGYFDDPIQTAASFLPDPYGVRLGSTMYRTGDRARFFADGTIEFLGRRDHQVKVRGFRVELGEIENALARCVGVRTAIVIARRDATRDKSLIAYIVAAPGAALSADTLRTHLRTTLPEYMVPRTYVFIDALPLNASGKPDRHRLPVPEAGDVERETTYVAPRTPIEAALAAIWAEVLRIDRIGIHDNFFALGGYSLLIVQVVALLRSRHDCEVAVRDVFGTRNLEELAQRVSFGAKRFVLSATADTPFKTIVDATAGPRSYLASRRVADEILWNDGHLDSTKAWFQYQFTVHIRAPHELPLIRRALQMVVEQHRVLTCRFSLDGESVWMHEGEFSDVEFTVVELDFDEGDDPLSLAKDWLLRATRRPFDRLAGPLCRFTVIPLGRHGSVLFAQIDHALFDLQSQDIFLTDLALALRAMRDNQVLSGDERAPTFSDYCLWHRSALTDEAWRRLQDYWKQQFAGPVAPYEALFGEPRGDAMGTRWQHHQWVLGPERSAQVGVISQRLGATPLVLFLAFFRWWALHERGVAQFEIETDVLGRVHPGFNRTIGFFSTNLVFRFTTLPITTLREVIAQTMHSFADGLAHQELPFFSLKRIANPALTTENFHWPIKFSHQASMLDDNARVATGRELAALQLGMPGGRAHPLCIYLTGTPADWRIDYYYDATIVAESAVVSLARDWECSLDLC